MKIITGMHRSGTSMLTRMLNVLGVELGEPLVPPSYDNPKGFWENRVFQGVNIRLLQWTKCNIDGFDHTRKLQNTCRKLHTAAIPQSVKDGIADYLKKSFRGTHWGWKDPRNTFTAPLWMDVFPAARLISVKRHGVDVAASLFTRSQSHWARTSRLGTGMMFLAGAAAGPFARSSPADTLEGGFRLWEQYVDASTSLVAGHDQHRTLEIVYEDLLSDPAAHIRRLAEFVDASPSTDELEAMASRVEGRRALAHRDDSALADFAESVRPDLETRGYPS